MNYLTCKKCEGQIVLHAFSYGNCEVCDTHVSTSHIPCNKVCDDCSLEFGICVSCGETLTDNE